MVLVGHTEVFCLYVLCVTRGCGCAGLVYAVNAARGEGLRTGGDADAEGGHHATGGLHDAARRARRGPHARRHRQIALRGVLFMRYVACAYLLTFSCGGASLFAGIGVS